MVFYGNMLGEIKKAERGEETKEGFGNAVAWSEIGAEDEESGVLSEVFYMGF